METPEMRKMREYRAENADRKRITTAEKNRQLVDQIYRIIEHWAKAESKAILQEKQAKAYTETEKTKAIVGDIQKRRIANGGGKKKKVIKKKRLN